MIETDFYRSVLKKVKKYSINLNSDNKYKSIIDYSINIRIGKLYL